MRLNPAQGSCDVSLNCEPAVSSSVTSAKAEVNGVHLHYLRTGDGEHAVLLLPGMLGARASVACPARCPLCSAPSPRCPGLIGSLSALLRCFL